MSLFSVVKIVNNLFFHSIRVYRPTFHPFLNERVVYGVKDRYKKKEDEFNFHLIRNRNYLGTFEPIKLITYSSISRTKHGFLVNNIVKIIQRKDFVIGFVYILLILCLESMATESSEPFSNSFK